MRTLAALAVVVATFGATHEAGAQGRYYPWCARYDPYSIVCGFDTRKQCQETVSGVGGICYENVMPPPMVHSRASGKRKYKRTY